MEGKIAPQVGQFVSSAPRVRVTRGRRNEYQFEDMAWRAQEHPNETLLAAVHVPVNRIKAVRMYVGDPFTNDHGHIKIEMRNSKIEAGVRFGDVYMTWVPNH